MMTKAGHIDALVLTPPTPDERFTRYLADRITAARDEDHALSLLAVLEEFGRTRRPSKIVVNTTNTHRSLTHDTS